MNAARKPLLTGLLTVLAFGAACSEAPEPLAPNLAATSDKLVNQPFELDYLKTETGNGTAMWTGSISGDLLTGGLETEVYELRVTGKIWHIKTYWTVTAGTRSFRAELDGTVNTETGALLLNGEIVSGLFVGARVHDEGTLVRVLPTGETVFEGKLWIMGASST
jgi:hypothetical protein